MPPRSEAQRRAMRAAASGNSTIGIPKSVGQDFSNADPGGPLPPTAPAPKAQRPSGGKSLQSMIGKGPRRG